MLPNSRKTSYLKPYHQRFMRITRNYKVKTSTYNHHKPKRRPVQTSMKSPHLKDNMEILKLMPAIQPQRREALLLMMTMIISINHYTQPQAEELIYQKPIHHNTITLANMTIWVKTMPHYHTPHHTIQADI
jgi:hypothetical protein